MADAQVEQVAKGLTKAQRALLFWVDDEGFRDWGMRGAPGNRATRMALRDLVTWENHPWMVRLSPLGLAVRDYLKEQGQ